MGLVIVVVSEAVYAVESWIVQLEGLPESFNLSLRCRFSSGTEDMFYSMLGAEVCEPAWAIVAPVLGTMI